MKTTNAMRLLTKAGIEFDTVEYEVDERDLSAVHASLSSGIPAERMFKTLVLKGMRTGHFVCCIPAAGEVDLKKAAAAMHDKKAELIAVRELLPLTGYVRGGCSPVGMKKRFPTLVHSSALCFDTIGVSAGVRGATLMLSPEDLISYTGAAVCDLICGS